MKANFVVDENPIFNEYYCLIVDKILFDLDDERETRHQQKYVPTMGFLFALLRLEETVQLF